MAEYLSLALSSFLSIDVFLGLLVGVVGGMIIGIIPGLGPSVGIALLLPNSFSMSPTAALVMMTAMYTTGVYGGSITAVLCHTPGTAASAATTQDGYEMTKKGRGMEAVSVVTIASVVGGIIGAICLILFAPALGRISQMFSCLEYFEMIEERIISFVSEHSRIDRERLKKLMHNTKMLTKDLGTVLVGKEAVECGLIDGEGGIRDAIGKLNRMMEENVVSHR